MCNQVYILHIKRYNYIEQKGRKCKKYSTTLYFMKKKVKFIEYFLQNRLKYTIREKGLWILRETNT